MNKLTIVRTFKTYIFAKLLGIGGAGVAIGASGVGSMWSFKSMFNTPEDPEKDAYEFYGAYASITTPTQKACNFVALDLSQKIEMQLRQCLKSGRLWLIV
ncbi:hypothetical protein ACVXZ0_16910 [Staphylococcus aureus]